MTLKNAKSLAEEVNLMESFRLLGFHAIVAMWLVVIQRESGWLRVIPMQICGRSLRRNRIAHINDQLQDLLIGCIWVRGGFLEFILRCTPGLGIVARERDLSRLVNEAFCRLDCTYQE